MKEEKFIKEKFNAMCAATAAYKDEIAKVLFDHAHPFFVADDMNEQRGLFIRVIEEELACHCVIDMVRSVDGLNIEAHKTAWRYDEVDEWTHIDNLGEEAAEFVLENIVWLNPDDIQWVAYNHNDKDIVDIITWTDCPVYFVNECGKTHQMVEKVVNLDNYENANGWFGVHRYDWSKAMKEIDEHNEKSHDVQ